METKDNLRAYMKELQREEPSADFTGMVMNRVRLEAIKSPVIYQPLISRQMWLKIYIGLALFILGAVLLRTWFPGNEAPALLQSFYRIDFSFLLKPFLFLSNALNKMSLPFIGGILAVSLLLLSDQLYAKYIAR
jgi:vacuolar-type H+-ATPase subunit I/STV1